MQAPHVITLPSLPPPLSACFKNAAKRGRVKTDRYKAWIAEALDAVRASKPPYFDSPVMVEYFFRRPDRRPRDLGNLEKATSDILVTAEVLKDDSLIADMRLAWGSVEPVTIIIREIA